MFRRFRFSSSGLFVVLGPIGLIVPLLAVVAKPAGAEEPVATIDIVHVGDSYSSGVGARVRNADGTFGSAEYAGVDGCSRSSWGWGGLYARSLTRSHGLRVNYKNRACSGSGIKTLSSWRFLEESVVSGEGACPSVEYPEEEYMHRAQGPHRSKCQRWVRPQIEGITADTDLVLLTIGGNNLNFRPVVERCFAPVLRRPSTCQREVEAAQKRLEGFEQGLVDLLTLIEKRLPAGARVVLVEYPYLVEPGYVLRQRFGPDMFAAGDRIRSLTDAATEQQRSAIERANAAAGRDFAVFVTGAKPVFEGRTPTSRVARAERLVWGFDRTSSEAYHFTGFGHQALAEVVAAQGTFGVADPVSQPPKG